MIALRFLSDLDARQPGHSRQGFRRPSSGCPRVSILESVGLIHRQRKLTGTKVVDTQYFLTEDGQAKAQELGAHSALKWYADRAQLVAEVGGSRSGTQLKKRQHKIAEYHETLYHVPIPPIETEVRKRLADMGASI